MFFCVFWDTKVELGIFCVQNNMLHYLSDLVCVFRQEPPSPAKIVTRYKSPYEQQLEQQKLAAQREEEASRLRDHQEALHHERLQEQLHRHQQLQERELMLRRQAEQDEEQFKQQLRLSLQQRAPPSLS